MLVNPLIGKSNPGLTLNRWEHLLLYPTGLLGPIPSQNRLRCLGTEKLKDMSKFVGII
jgi:hypothetical protein